MSRAFYPAFGRAFIRPAFGAALAASVALAAMSASPATAQRAKAAAESVSPGFAKVAQPFQKAVNDAKTRGNVVAAKGNPAALAAALAPEKAQLDPLFAAATTPYDKYVAGSLALGLGQVAEDPAILRRGLAAMVDSGKTPPQDIGKLRFFLGQTAYQAKDYAASEAALEAAIAGGYRDNDAEAMLAQAYMSDNKPAQGLAVLRRAIADKGSAAPESWYRVGLGAAFKAKLPDQAAFFGAGLVRAYPTTQNWAAAITVLRDTARYAPQDAIDLLRLMGRTQSFLETNDYLEYIQTADPRRLPGEVLDVIAAGTAAGKIPAGNRYAAEAKQAASQLVVSDRASLPSIERDARAPNASANVVTAAGDSFLSYKNPAKAAEFYSMALSKPGADQARVLTRLGIAQVDQGNYAAAQATFAKVEGPRKPLAQLWAIYAAQKAAGR